MALSNAEKQRRYRERHLQYERETQQTLALRKDRIAELERENELLRAKLGAVDAIKALREKVEGA